MEHHAYLVAGPLAAGKAAALRAAAEVIGGEAEGNPDIISREYSIFSVDDARALYALAWQRPLVGNKKALIIVATRLYHEAQNALLKLFEEPPADTVIYLVVASAGGIIPTLRSRLIALPGLEQEESAEINDEAAAFLKASPEKRSDIIKKLADAKGEEKKRAARDTALAILEGVERAAYEKWRASPKGAELTPLLEELGQLRSYLQDRSAPLRMILEHISLTIPRGL
jgi:DNA polymerase III delta prime subunit